MYRANGIRKRFGGVTALSGVDFTLEPGSVHALLGENGAGKSTLVRILAGALTPDAGTLTIDDVPVLTNLFLTREPRRGPLVDRREMARRAEPVLAELELDRPLRTPVRDLSPTERQLVEIARALLDEPSVLILDEPTSALPADRAEHLLAIVDRLRARGVAVLYVSQLLAEVMLIADRITVLRDGGPVLSAPRRALSIPDVVTAMVGVREEAPPPRGRAKPGNGGLRLVDLTVPGVLHDVTLTAARSSAARVRKARATPVCSRW